MTDERLKEMRFFAGGLELNIHDDLQGAAEIIHELIAHTEQTTEKMSILRGIVKGMEGAAVDEDHWKVRKLADLYYEEELKETK